MKDKSVARAIIDFAKSNNAISETNFTYAEVPDEIFTVTITRNKKQKLSERASMEAYANTISALPSGSNCRCCNGTGRSH
ncbi:hypothetical protein [Pseudomonas sp. S49]|uniref:hypothetical protein n=1 Tax=Pseudomonas sp. S49 TaxID=1573720 RepID=UPI00135BA4E6|nr:hypothetical protein [Pseudomonas sp. S49]